MSNNVLSERFLFAVLAGFLMGAPLYGGGGVGPTLSSGDINQISVKMQPLSSTMVGYKEDVLFEIRLKNNRESTVRLDLWFTVDLTGLETERYVKPPYMDKEAPFSGYIQGWDEVILRLEARPLENVPSGPYTFFSKVGLYDENFVKVMGSFKGVIYENMAHNPSLPDNWVVSSIWAVNEAGRAFLAGNGRLFQGIPKTVDMIQNYPNPFNPATSITYEVKPVITSGVPVKLTIYDIHGRFIRSLVDEEKHAGIYTVKWDGKDESGMTVNSGVYVFKIQSGEDISLRKGLLTK